MYRWPAWVLRVFATKHVGHIRRERTPHRKPAPLRPQRSAKRPQREPLQGRAHRRMTRLEYGFGFAHFRICPNRPASRAGRPQWAASSSSAHWPQSTPRVPRVPPLRVPPEYPQSTLRVGLRLSACQQAGRPGPRPLVGRGGPLAAARNPAARLAVPGPATGHAVHRATQCGHCCFHAHSADITCPRWRAY